MGHEQGRGRGTRPCPGAKSKAGGHEALSGGKSKAWGHKVLSGDQEQGLSWIALHASLVTLNVLLSLSALKHSPTARKSTSLKDGDETTECRLYLLVVIMVTLAPDRQASTAFLKRGSRGLDWGP